MTINDVDNGKVNFTPDDVEREVFLARQMEYVKGALDGLKGVAEKKSLSGLSQEDKIFEIKALLESIPSIVMTVVMSQGQTPEVNINLFINLVNVFGSIIVEMVTHMDSGHDKLIADMIERLDNTFDDIISKMVDHLDRNKDLTTYQATAEAVLEDIRKVAKELKELGS